MNGGPTGGSNTGSNANSASAITAPVVTLFGIPASILSLVTLALQNSVLSLLLTYVSYQTGSLDEPVLPCPFIEKPTDLLPICRHCSSATLISHKRVPLSSHILLHLRSCYRKLSKAWSASLSPYTSSILLNFRMGNMSQYRRTAGR